MRELFKLLAAICSILFIITGVLVLLLFNIEQKAFSSTTYKQAFEDQKLYERMPALLASALQASVSQNQNSFPFLRELSVEDWQSTIASLLPPDEMRALADGALDSTFDYINGKTNSAVISLLPIKSHLVGESGVNVIQQFLKAQPDCTVEQLTQMGLGFLGGDIALCNPPPEAIGFLRSAIHFSPFVVVLLLLAIALFAIRNLGDFLIWWGGPLLITGVISALIGLVGSPLVGSFLQFLIRTQGAIFLPSLLASSIAETASAVAHQILIPVAVQGFILTLIGLIMVAVGVFLGRRTVYQIA